jgi:thiol-disulfide isomerase/thioredoxin
LDGDIFQYTGYKENGKTIIIQGKSISQIDTKHSGKTYIQKASENAINDIKTAQVGFSAPDITGTDISSGSKISLSDLKGKYIYVDFWSTSCGPCIADFPAYKAIYDKLDKTKIAFIGMADERTQGRVKELNSKFGLMWPTIITNKKETKTDGYHIESYPTSFLINPEGKIIHKNLRPDNLKIVLQQLF